MNCKTVFSRHIRRLVDLGWWSWLVGLCLDPAPPLGEVLRCAFPGSSAHHSPLPWPIHTPTPDMNGPSSWSGRKESNEFGSYCSRRSAAYKVFKEAKEETSYSRKRWLLSYRFFLNSQPIKCSTEAVEVLRIFRGIVEPMRGLLLDPGQITSLQQLRTDQ